MSLAANLISKISVVETLTGTYVSPNDSTVTVDQLSDNVSLGAATTPAVIKQAQYQVTLSTGTATINLASLPGLTSEETVVGTGLKVQMLKLRNLSTNANGMTVTKGASNGYGLNAASTTWLVGLDPGQSVLFYLDNSAITIASDKRTIDVAGTGSQILEVAVVIG